jgi:hypothetical protein
LGDGIRELARATVVVNLDSPTGLRSVHRRYDRHKSPERTVPGNPPSLWNSNASTLNWPPSCQSYRLPFSRRSLAHSSIYFRRNQGSTCAADTTRRSSARFLTKPYRLDRTDGGSEIAAAAHGTAALRHQRDRSARIGQKVHRPVAAKTKEPLEFLHVARGSPKRG